LAQAFAAHDTWNWYVNVITQKYPDAFVSAPAYKNGIPSSGFYFRLAVLLTKDGRWLQFSQTFPRLFRAFMRVLDLEWMYDDPKWEAVPDFPEESQRVELWEKMIDAARSKTVAEWDEVFDAERDVWGELFRHGVELLDHPQLVHDKQVVTIDDADRGPVRQPGPLVRLDRTPAQIGRGAPPVGESGAPSGVVASDTPPPAPAADPGKQMPLEGVTILEFATMYAAPYASTLLSDLGAKVIKVEPLEGDLIRHVLPFPELGGMKVMQGKESIAVDLSTEEGRAIVQEFAKKADVVVQSYRSGVAARLGVDDKTLLALNPDLIYLNAPGYGVDGPAGHRPAFAPTIGAAAGLAMRNAGGSVAERSDLSTEEVKRHSINLFRSNAPVSAQADGFSALAAATALLLGLLGRARGSGGQSMLTTMVSSVSHALGDDMVDYVGRPPAIKADADLLGLNALYRLYETADGWVFLAAPAESDWAPLTYELDLPADPRFETLEGRQHNDSALSDSLATALRLHSAAEWEERLTKHDVGCVAVDERGPELVLMGELGRAAGYVADVEHPIYGEHVRLSPLVRFSRSATVAKPSCLTGDCTDALLADIGFSEEKIAELRVRQIVA
jgi:crotonobetainyl-CoA:carnitine CoA-transferase CaiB-like acyl-CoA transferase